MFDTGHKVTRLQCRKYLFLQKHYSKFKNHVLKSAQLVELTGVDTSFRSSGGYSSWLGVRETYDALEFLNLSEPYNLSFVVADHYGIGVDWEKTVVSQIENLVVLDDLARQKHVAKVLVDQSLGRSKFDYRSLVSSDCCILAGVKYGLLREEYSERRLSDDNKKYHALVNFGGVDKENYTLHVLELVNRLIVERPLNIKIIIGKDYPFHSRLLDSISESPHNVVLLVGADDMARETAECKFSIGGGGVSFN